MLQENKVYKFCQQVKQEAARIVWLNKKELFTATSVVLIAVLVFSLICVLLDYGIHSIMQFLLNIGK